MYLNFVVNLKGVVYNYSNSIIIINNGNGEKK